MEGFGRKAGWPAGLVDWILELDADERVDGLLAAEIRRVIGSSSFAWHQVPVDNYVGDRLLRHGWAGSFGTTSVPRLFQRGAKRWRALSSGRPRSRMVLH